MKRISTVGPKSGGGVGSSGDRLCQTRPIPRSPDGDNKDENIVNSFNAPVDNFPLNCTYLSRLLPEGSCHLLPRQRLLSISIRNFSLEHFLLICCQFYSITMASLSRCDQSTLPSDNLKQSENFSLERKVVR